MRQLINSTFLTLDGVVEGPHLWPSLKRGTSDEGDTVQTDLLETCDIVLMGAAPTSRSLLRGQAAVATGTRIASTPCARWSSRPRSPTHSGTTPK
jgi:hypothetical protein